MRAELVREAILPVLAILILALGGGATAWVYVTRPVSFADAATGAKVAAGVYQVDEARFQSGLGLFRREQFAAARDEWARADPAQRDARTQFYVAYAFYRQGWSRLRHDDALFKQGLAAVERAQALSAQAPWTSDDPDLRIRTPAELRAEIQRGLTASWEDLNPLRVLDERK